MFYFQNIQNVLTVVLMEDVLMKTRRLCVRVILDTLEQTAMKVNQILIFSPCQHELQKT